MSSTFTEAWLAGPQSTQMYTRTYKADDAKAILVFVHGFCEHIGRYEHVHPVFAARGISVFCYDQRGFGKTALDEGHKSKDSAYGKTSFKNQVEDIEWAIKHARSEFGELPTFLMGHSMGGGLALAFPTRTDSPPDKGTVALLSGVISSSPLITLTNPAPKIQRLIGGMVSVLVPYLTIPAPTKAEDLSHDKAVTDAYKNDPLIKQIGSLRGIGDMLNIGDQLLLKSHKNWPATLPVLFIHGDADKVTSHSSSKVFFENLKVKDKKMSLYPGGYHELMNEPDGVKEKAVEECITFIESHLDKHTDVSAAKL